MRALRLPAYVRANQHQWDRDSASYEAEHGATLARHGGMAWGLWRQAEAEIHALGDLSALVGRDVLELGCGAARWAIALARLGARCIGLDVSAAQLAQAQRLMIAARVDFPLLHASAEAVPLPDASCDLIMSDYGALTYANPGRVLGEVARLLRPDGRAVWCTPTAEVLAVAGIRGHCEDAPVVVAPGQPPQFVLRTPTWRARLHGHRLALRCHILLRPAPVATTTFYGPVMAHRARCRPLEQVWVVATQQDGLYGAA